MEILYLAHRIPYPPNKGDKIRSFNEIKHLAASHEVDLICLADSKSDLQYREDLKKICGKVFAAPLSTKRALLNGSLFLASGAPLSAGYFYVKEVQKTFDSWLAKHRYDAIICFSSPMAEYIFRSRVLKTDQREKAFMIRHPTPPRLLMDFCDVDSDKWKQYADTAPFPLSRMYALEHRRLSRYERQIADRFDASIFVSEKEAELFRAQNPDLNTIHVITNGVDQNYFNPDLHFSDPFTRRPNPSISGDTCYSSLITHHSSLLFTGAMDYPANVDGVTWFCREVFPGIKSAFPDVQFYIVGSNPRKDVLQLQTIDGVNVTGFVEDIRPYYSHADVCVTPLRLARGIQNKILEAMAMGKPVITTSKAAEGINAVPGKHFLLADDPDQFIQTVSMLLQAPEKRKQLGLEAREYVKTAHDWDTNMRKLEELLKNHGQRRLMSGR